VSSQLLAEPRSELVERVLAAHDLLFRRLFAGQVSAWLDVDLTMPQLKTLLLVLDTPGATGGQLARGLGVSLSTVTGLVDRLVSHGLVTRGEDPDDRRITRVEPTADGRRLGRRLYSYRRERMSRILDRLDPDQLRTVERAIGHLIAAAGDLGDEPATAASRRPQEVAP
jgi:DNA-binding MarR family transcriptional regulator